MLEEKSLLMSLYLYASSPCPSIIVSQYLIDSFHVNVSANMVGKLVILPFLKAFVILKVKVKVRVKVRVKV